jgi:hypothetical protein
MTIEDPQGIIRIEISYQGLKKKGGKCVGNKCYILVRLATFCNPSNCNFTFTCHEAPKLHSLRLFPEKSPFGSNNTRWREMEHLVPRSSKIFGEHDLLSCLWRPALHGEVLLGAFTLTSWLEHCPQGFWNRRKLALGTGIFPCRDFPILDIRRTRERFVGPQRLFHKNTIVTV